MKLSLPDAAGQGVWTCIIVTSARRWLNFLDEKLGLAAKNERV
jgi:hypothetical protein